MIWLASAGILSFIYCSLSLVGVLDYIRPSTGRGFDGRCWKVGAACRLKIFRAFI